MSLSNLMYDNTARVDTILHLSAMYTEADAPASPLRDFFDDIDATTLARLFPWFVAPEDDEDEIDCEALLETAAMHREDGFLICISTPVMRHRGTSASYSWGHYRTHWVYAQTFEAAIEQGLAWVAEQRENEKAEQL